MGYLFYRVNYVGEKGYCQSEFYIISWGHPLSFPNRIR
jgi:hypothetical protein